MSARPAAAALAIALALAGCGRPAPTVELTLAGERFQVTPPRGWVHLDQGREQVFRRAEQRIVLRDLGPTDPESLGVEPPLDSLALASWPGIEDDERRALRGITARAIAGRPGQVVETWDRVAHTWPRRHAFFVAGGKLFVLSGWAEVDPAVGRAFEELLASLAPLDDPGAGPAADAPPPSPGTPAVSGGAQDPAGR